MKIAGVIICIIGLIICLCVVGIIEHDDETHDETLTLGEFVLIAIIGLIMFVGGFAIYRCYDRGN